MKNFIVALFILFLFLGCSSTKISHQGQLAQEPSEVKATYGWLENSTPSNDLRVNNPSIENMVHQSVEKHLKARGYIKTDPAQADYLITWFGSIKDEIKLISISQYYSTFGYSTLKGNYPGGAVNGKVRKNFSHGTLILDVLDRSGNKLLWRGTATNTLRENMNKSRAKSYIDTSVEKILQELPQR
jgi:hypothetical protein